MATTQIMTRKAYRVGNSAGVLVPKEWMNGFIEVRLVDPPLRIDAPLILEILQKENINISEILGIAFTGSYARGDQEKGSDVDILVISQRLNKKLKVGRYEIIILSEKTLEHQLYNMGFPILPMILEGKALLNEKLFERYKKKKLSKKALRWLIKTTKSSMKISSEQISIFKELSEKKLSDNHSYSLILRLRTLYMVECLMKNKKYAKRDFLNLVKTISGSLTAYNGYINIKENKKIKKELKFEEAEKIIEYINEKIIKLKNG